MSSTPASTDRVVSARLVLIRHAPAESDGRLCGWFDVPVSAAGVAQLEGLLERRPSQVIPAALYTSTLTRATHVADRLAQAWRIEPRAADWAREIDCGALEGVSLNEIQQRFPDLWARNQAQNDDDFSWPGGESYREFRDRILEGLRTVATAHAGQRVAVVTHAGVVSQVVGVIHGRPASVWLPDRPQLLRATEITCDAVGPIDVLAHDEPDWY